MLRTQCLLYLGVLVGITAANEMLNKCIRGNHSFLMNVVLLEDSTHDWSLRYVKEAVQNAIEKDYKINQAEGLSLKLTASYTGFDTAAYNRPGCGSSSCEGVEILKELHVGEHTLGCIMLGPSCTFATYQLVDEEVGLKLSIPVISAGSFGLSCDYKPKLTRLLPPGRKIADFLLHFLVKEVPDVKPVWDIAYVYKNENGSEECFWYINALEAPSASFAKGFDRVMVRGEKAFHDELTEKHGKRKSNSIVCCGDMRACCGDNESGCVGVIMRAFCVVVIMTACCFVVIMRTCCVVVIMMPPLLQINDYVAGYHNGALLFGQVLREELRKIPRASSIDDNPFGNVTFDGWGGRYVLDEYGDRDANFSVIYTTKTTGKVLPPVSSSSCLLLSPPLYSCLLLSPPVSSSLFLQNRKARKSQKKWSHINPDLIGPLDEKEVSLTLLGIDYYNLAKFYGTVKYEWGVFGVFELCERGSLRHVLNDLISYPDEAFMDMEFKISVMYDIAKGMSYLHSSSIESHGRLKSTNCVVDNRMVVKITDFGCHTILTPALDLWTSPEHLRVEGVSQKGDIYSYSIIAHEIVLRRPTFYTACCSERAEKLHRVQYPSGQTLFRPDLNFQTATETELELFTLIKNCWDEDPERRPDFKKIEGTLGKIFSNLHDQVSETYMDNLIRRLQMYSRNLEHLVEERTSLYKAERDRADRLNFMLLPGPVVRSLKEKGCVEPELFEEVTVYFSDIVGFTTLCHYSTPMEVVDMLNDIYKNFDSILDHHDVYKVETIGDAYMVASGLPRCNGNRHAVDIAHMALDILAFVGTFQLQHLPGIPLWIRIGVHSGPCAAGVVGNKMPRYCLFGDTVNTASRMESTGLPLRIHVSESTINILQRTDCKFEYEKRGETFLKGKGNEMTYWLTGVTGGEYDLPTPPTAENFQRLQQDLAEMIMSSLESRSAGSGPLEKRKTLSTRVRRRETNSSLPSDGLPAYFDLAVTDNPSTYL
uniref:Guanylate cyclase n=1 Tax=Gadus morhua TaxID=8049 RepID=A0A8C5AS57_GADMO